MKGVVFTELLEMVSTTFGEDVADDILDESDLESGGVYTSVGTYSHKEVIVLVKALSARVDMPVTDLVRAFGGYLFTKFAQAHPHFMSSKSDAFLLLEGVDQEIHVEVRKLYPEAELPHFSTERKGDEVLIMSYWSSRPFADLAEGLIGGCIEHYGEKIEVLRETPTDEATSARFRLTRG